jgi:hypothetical protein
MDTADPGAFRNYETSVRSSVRDVYRLNHQRQTLAFV